MIHFRHADPRYPFLWEHAAQPAGRWHAQGAGPAQYLSDTPDGAWAEFLRHEEIRDPADLAGVRRALWAVELPDEPAATPDLPEHVLTGGIESHAACREEARRLREAGHRRLAAPAAALVPGEARGRCVAGGLQPGPPRDGRVVVLYGRRPDLVGWAVVSDGRPPGELLTRVRHLGGGA